MSQLAPRLGNYRLTTAKIIYHLPDAPLLLQSYIWQELDLPPDFPALEEFLDFWERRLDGKLHSVRIASTDLIEPSEVRWVGHSLALH